MHSVRKKLLLISSCILISSCSQISLNEASQEEILKEFRSSESYQKYRNSDGLSATVIITFQVESSGIRIDTMNSGEASAFQAFALKRDLKVLNVFTRLN